jgi:hypothetical protein
MMGVIAGLILIVYWIYSCFVVPLTAMRRLQDSQVKPAAVTNSNITGCDNSLFNCIPISSSRCFESNSIFGSIHIDLGFLWRLVLALYMLLIGP